VVLDIQFKMIQYAVNTLTSASHGNLRLTLCRFPSYDDMRRDILAVKYILVHFMPGYYIDLLNLVKCFP
jgi:hypothetical protein